MIFPSLSFDDGHANGAAEGGSRRLQNFEFIGLNRIHRMGVATSPNDVKL